MENQQTPNRKREKNQNLNPPLGISVTEGRFHNTLVFVEAKDKHPVEGIEDFLNKCETENKKSAVFVSVPEQYFIHYLPLLKKKGYQFHSFGQYGDPGFTYYKWTNPKEHDKVPKYATSIEGAAGLILSPDEKRVLLVYEKNMWKFLSGAVDEGESSIETIVREAKEEAGLTIDLNAFNPVYLGGWNKKKARNTINDNFRVYVIKATSEKLEIDFGELRDAKWFEMNTLLSLLNIKPKDSIIFDKDGNRFDYFSLKWLQNFKKGKYFDVIQKQGRNYFA